MYRPRYFREDDPHVLHALMQRYSFATLFSQADGVPWATPLPFMLDATRGPHGTLMAHMARANPHWKTFRADTQVLVVFQGPHAYISPSWYREQKAVPTWNYVAVQARGIPALIEDPDRLRKMVLDLVTVHEAEARSSWDPALAEPRMGTNLKAIVGFEIRITHLEGKHKLNQNRSAADQQGVVEALQQSSDSGERDVAALMRENLSRNAG